MKSLLPVALILLAGCATKNCTINTWNDGTYNAFVAPDGWVCADVNIETWPDTYTVQIWHPDGHPKHEEDVTGRDAALKVASRYCTPSNR
jgi:hypothetical protein